MKKAIAGISLFLLLVAMLPVAVQAQSPVKRALVFGLGEQEDTSWGRINGDRDVDYVLKMLDKMGYADVVTLKNRQATKQAMVKAFEALAKRCKPGDIVYVNYSGHGQMMTDLNGDESHKWRNSHASWDESWVPYDAYMVYCEKDKGDKHLSDDEVARYLTAVRRAIGDNGELVVVVDACHSGDATCGEDEAPVRGISVKFNIPYGEDVPLEKPTAEKWLTISACKPFQLNTEVPNPQVGKLTYALYLMGEEVFNCDNEELQSVLDAFMKRYKARLPQSPMVTGSKK